MTTHVLSIMQDVPKQSGSFFSSILTSKFFQSCNWEFGVCRVVGIPSTRRIAWAGSFRLEDQEKRAELTFR